jgi:uncharacterized protein involved in outer membrane biogenesis
MKKILKWFFGAVLLVVVLAVVLRLSLDTILRVIAENRIRAQTGMDAEIGKFHVGLLEPVVSIENLRLYNPPAFGGTPFLDIREIHVEYDRAALVKNQIHITLMRFNLGELDIVRNEAGQTNIFSLGVALPAKNAPGGNIGLKEFKQRTGLDFRGVDVLNVSVGTARFIDLKDPSHDRAQNIGIDNLVMKNVKTEADLAGLAALVALRGSEVFGVLVDQKNSGAEVQKLLGF